MTGPASISTKIIIITGPTASGKTSCSLELAVLIGGEIINADVGQFYAPLSIGTAKPELPHPTIPHHLFDIVQTPENINVTQYRQFVFFQIEQVLARGKTPILVGGSLFYIKSLFFPPFELETQDDSLEFDLEAQYAHQSTEELWDVLHKIDAERATKLYKQDRYRILRALYLWHKFATKPSDCVPQFDFPYEACLVYIAPEPEEHKKNIALRTHQMLDEGWIEETQNLMETPWQIFLEKKGLIGYPEIFAWLKQGAKPTTKPELELKIIQKTWQYARRQRIFWASFKRQLELALKNEEKEAFLSIFESNSFPQIISDLVRFLKK